MEKDMVILQENQMTLSEQLKETQRYLIKIAKNHSEISKRLASWPFIAVERGEDAQYSKMKKQKFDNYDREKKIHKVVKGNKQNKHKKNLQKYYELSDESHLDDVRSKPIR